MNREEGTQKQGKQRKSVYIKCRLYSGFISNMFQACQTEINFVSETGFLTGQCSEISFLNESVSFKGEEVSAASPNDTALHEKGA